MSKTKVNPVACWSFSLDIECPKCGHDLDLVENDDFWDGRPNSFNILHSKDEDIICPECDHEFVCDFEY